MPRIHAEFGISCAVLRAITRITRGRNNCVRRAKNCENVPCAKDYHTNVQSIEVFYQSVLSEEVKFVPCNPNAQVSTRRGLILNHPACSLHLKRANTSKSHNVLYGLASCESDYAILLHTPRPAGAMEVCALRKEHLQRMLELGG
jgi:hypothetical protein